MSAVDVLAVIGILASIVRTDNGNKYPEINTLLDDAEKARAAVAELIEALREIAEVTTPGDGVPNVGWINHRAHTALARATGVKS